MAGSFWEDEEIIGEVKKGKNAKIIVKRCFTRGENYLDVRNYYKDGDEYKPTSKGIAIPDKNLDEVLALIGVYRDKINGVEEEAV
jgi:hypothetical protein